MMGRAPSSASSRSIAHSSGLRRSGSPSRDCCSIRVCTLGLQIEANGVLLAHNLRKKSARVDNLELAIDIDVLQLVDQDHPRIAVDRKVARRYLDLQPVGGPIAELFHYLP